jgi:uncharacterized membrane protein
LYVEALSLLTAFCYAFSSILVRKGMKHSNPATASLTSTSIQFIILTLLLLEDIPRLNWNSLAFFIASGISSSGFGRLFNYRSVNKLGVATSSAFIGISPLITTVLAIIFLSENMVVTTILGAVMVVAGIFILSYQKGGFNLSKNHMFPFLSAFFYSAAGIMRKAGLNIQAESILGAQVGAMAGMLSFFIYLSITGNFNQINVNRNSLPYFIGSGITVSVAWIALFSAIKVGQVSLVSTLVGTHPLFSLVLSYLTLKGTEDLSWNIIIGSVITVLGISVITFF